MNQVILAHEADEASYRPALTIGTAGRGYTNAAAVYLASLGSSESQRVMASYLSIVARAVSSRSKTIKATSFLDFPWGVMRRADVVGIVSMLKDGNRSPATINTYLYGLKGVAREAWALGQISSDDHQHIQSLKPVRGSRLSKGRVLSQADIDALLQTCQADRSEIGVRDYAMMQILLGVGLRRAEIVSLDLANLAPSSGKIRVLGKGNKEREAYLPSVGWRALNYWIDQVRGAEPGPLFCRIRKGGDVQGTRLSAQSVLHILQNRCTEAGIEHVAPHDLRRTYATMLIEDGNDLVTVRNSMGHASVSTTERYIRPDEEAFRRASERLGQRL